MLRSLDRFIVFGQEHLDHVCREYVEHYHAERPHQAKGNRPLTGTAAATQSIGEVLCRERLWRGAAALPQGSRGVTTTPRGALLRGRGA
jgi:hypothetical protein